MRRTIKNLVLLIAMVIALLSIYPPFSLQSEIEKRVLAKMEAAGLSNPEFKLRSLTSKEAVISRLAFKKDGVVVEMSDLRLTADAFPVKDVLNERYDGMKIRWSLPSLYVDGLAYPFPLLAGSGNLIFEYNAPRVSGNLASADKAVDITFTANHAEVALKSVRLPWEGAKVSAEDIVYSLVNPVPTYVILYVENLDMAHLLHLVTGERASGTGKLSGAVPVVFAADGGFMPGKARLEVKGGGTLTLSPEALPGDSPQMQMARDALTGFHYEHLILTSETDKTGLLSIHLEIGGNNPNAFEGRPVKLNVNLTGDVLQLLEQTLIPSADPRKFLEQEQ